MPKPLEFYLDNDVPTYRVPGESGRRKLHDTGEKAAPQGTLGSVTQASTRATGVTINSLYGTITTNNTSLAAEASAVFVVTNNKVSIGDVVLVCQRSGKVALNTSVEVTAVAAGSFSITVVNGNAAAGTAETGAILINFAVFKPIF
jgi:hypothetical protein